MTRDDLIAFEKEIARRWEAGEIHAPVHLSGGNEDSLIEIFQNIKRTDWICATWRSHYAALLHGVPPDELMRQILAGKSMSVNSVDPPFYSSAIAGGILPVAVGLGMAIKRKGEDQKVFCFIGDMTAATGGFEEATKYAWNFQLPVTFVVEDNGLSVRTPTKEAWGQPWPYEFRKNVIYYKYELTWPHHGSGVHIAF